MLQKMVNFFGWMDSHGHCRSCLFGKVEKHKWNRTGDGQTEASETEGDEGEEDMVSEFVSWVKEWILNIV